MEITKEVSAWPARGEVPVHNPATDTGRGRRPAWRLQTKLSYRQVESKIAISAALLIPLFWHAHIEAGDLASHTYNAWLVSLIHTGSAPGLWIARQYNNVLFDWMLSAFGEHIAVSLGVLTFFWGSYALVTTFAGREAIHAVPLLAMVSYGWTFHMGFFNYYIGLGIAFFAVAAVWRNVRTGALVSLILAPLAWLAHPISAGMLAALVAYTAACKLVPRQYHFLFLLAALGTIIATRQYLGSRFHVWWGNADPFFLNGTDQLVTFGPRYAVLGYIVLAILASAIVTRMVVGQVRPAVPAQLYLISWLTALWLPDYIPLPGYAAPLAYVTVRLTAVCGVLAAVLYAATRPRAAYTVALFGVAIVYFGMTYQDTGILSQAESKVARLVAPGERVLFVAPPASYSGSRVGANHLADRPCIGRCFSFSNYEASSLEFRVRAEVGNRIVASEATDSAAMQMGQYVVRPSDLPGIAVYQCGPRITELCARPLVAGVVNGTGAY